MALGESEEVGVAGIFGLGNLVIAQAAGLAAGSAVSGVDDVIGAGVRRRRR